MLFTEMSDPIIITSADGAELSAWNPCDAERMDPVRGVWLPIRWPFEQLATWDQTDGNAWIGPPVQVNGIDMRAWFATASGPRMWMCAPHMDSELAGDTAATESTSICQRCRKPPATATSSFCRICGSKLDLCRTLTQEIVGSRIHLPISWCPKVAII